LLLWDVHVHFDCSGSHKVCRASLVCSGLRPFTWKFLHKMALVTCPCAFRLRRVVQNVRRWSGLLLACGLLPVIFCIKWRLWHVHVHFGCAGSHKTCGAGLACSWSACKFPHKIALVTCPCAFRFGMLAENVRRGLGLRRFTCKFRPKWLLSHVHVIFNCAGWHKTCGAVLVWWCGDDVEDGHVDVHSIVQACAKCAPRFWARALFL